MLEEFDLGQWSGGGPYADFRCLVIESRDEFDRLLAETPREPFEDCVEPGLRPGGDPDEWD